MKLIKDIKVLVVGLGLMGGSYCKALTNLGFEVGGIARRKETVDYALAHNMIAHGQTEATEEYVSQFDIIVFALYPHIFKEWLKNYQQFLKPGALITDVTGVKVPVVYDIQAMLREDVEFIAAHPMAGRETSGIEAANVEMFRGANYIVTPTEKNSSEAIEACKEIGKLLGFKTIAVLTPEQHDEMIGFLSQLTHCIAVSLMVSKDSEHLVDYTGDSFRDLTRIAKINDEMWTELFLLNKNELMAQMDLFIAKFKELRDYIAEDNRDAMKQMMKDSTARRKLFDKKP